MSKVTKAAPSAEEIYERAQAAKLAAATGEADGKKLDMRPEETAKGTAGAPGTAGSDQADQRAREQVDGGPGQTTLAGQTAAPVPEPLLTPGAKERALPVHAAVSYGPSEEEMSPAQRKRENALNAMYRRAGKLRRRRELAAGFAQALLQNPNVDKYVLGSPFDGHLIDGRISVGAHLAGQCWELAADFEAALRERFEASAKGLAEAAVAEFEADIAVDARLLDEIN